MRKILLGLLLTCLFTYCTIQDTKKDTAVISGIAENIGQIEIVLYNRPPEINEDIYTIQVEDTSGFSLSIPIENLRFGFILITDLTQVNNFFCKFTKLLTCVRSVSNS